MAPEELMKPRYKVIALYPNSPFKIGEVLELGKDEYDAWVYLYDYDGVDLWHESYFNSYPHLFKKLEWWEGLKPEEMPSYVKHKNGNIYKVSEYSEGLIGVVIEGGFWAHLKNLFPATKEQYEEYIKQKQ
jgi:hypothetical protein